MKNWTGLITCKFSFNIIYNYKKIKKSKTTISLSLHICYSSLAMDNQELAKNEVSAAEAGPLTDFRTS